jgi:hypothetical protein
VIDCATRTLYILYLNAFISTTFLKSLPTLLTPRFTGIAVISKQKWRQSITDFLSLPYLFIKALLSVTQKKVHVLC